MNGRRWPFSDVQAVIPRKFSGMSGFDPKQTFPYISAFGDKYPPGVVSEHPVIQIKKAGNKK